MSFDPRTSCAPFLKSSTVQILLLLLDYALTWAESEATCVQKGGHLVSIFDEVEQDFIIQLAHIYELPGIWIGLNELRSTNTYEWSDGESVSG